jgi:hypothetical protein
MITGADSTLCVEAESRNFFRPHHFVRLTMTAMKQSDLAVDCVLDWNQARRGPANLALLKMDF